MKNESWIIVDLNTKAALFGIGAITFRFSSHEVANEVASQLFKDDTCYILVMITEPLK